MLILVNCINNVHNFCPKVYYKSQTILGTILMRKEVVAGIHVPA